MKGIKKNIGLIFLNIFYAVGNDTNFSIKQCDAIENTQDVFLFSHGLGATQQQGLTLFCKSAENLRWIMQGNVALFDYPDAKNDNMEYYRNLVNLGQSDDINRFNEAFVKTKTLLPDYRITLFGISRGSAVILNYVALYQPNCVQALVVESPFDTLSSIIKHLLARYYINWLPFSSKIGLKICQNHFPKIDPKGIFPMHVVEKIPLTMPILLLHSKKDKVVPINSSRRLYIKLRESGHEHAYLVELASGNHGKLIIGPDADYYYYVVHAFYKKYGIAHDPDAAQKGQALLAYCQPPIQEVIKRLKHRNVDEPELDFELESEDPELLALLPSD